MPCITRVSLFLDPPPPPDVRTLSLHDALPISRLESRPGSAGDPLDHRATGNSPAAPSRTRSDRDRKSTRLNSSHVSISYAVFCLKKKNPANPKPNLLHTVGANPLNLVHNVLSI